MSGACVFLARLLQSRQVRSAVSFQTLQSPGTAGGAPPFSFLLSSVWEDKSQGLFQGLKVWLLQGQSKQVAQRVGL